MITVRLLLALACCVTLCLAEGDGWSWTCENITEQKHVDIDKLLGKWYYVEWIVPGKIEHDHKCKVLNISRTGNSSVLLFQYNETAPVKEGRTTNVNTTLVSPNKWLAGEMSQKVVDFPVDGRTLTVSYCNPNISTAVFSRTSRLDLAALHERLKHAGVVGVEHAQAFDRTACPADKTSGAAHSSQQAGMYGLLLSLAILLYNCRRQITSYTLAV